jgi:hypothetical protein
VDQRTAIYFFLLRLATVLFNVLMKYVAMKEKARLQSASGNPKKKPLGNLSGQSSTATSRAASPVPDAKRAAKTMGGSNLKSQTLKEDTDLNDMASGLSIDDDAEGEPPPVAIKDRQKILNEVRASLENAPEGRKKLSLVIIGAI